MVALKSDTAAEKSKDQLSRDFPGRSIFDFCNSIGGRPEVAGARQIDANDQSYLAVGRLPARVLFLRREV